MPLKSVPRHIITRHFPFLWHQRLSKRFLGKETNFSNPGDLNEKIQWLMFYSDTSQWPLLADKYRVRKFVERRIGADYLIPLLGKWDSAEEIDFTSLPNQFVIKPNNGSFDVIVVKDKASADIELIRKKLAASLSTSFAYETGETHYLKIPPCIIAEELLRCDEPGGLIDYKIWCFNGKPHCVFLCANRDNEHHKLDCIYYDLNWARHDENMTVHNQFNCPRPANLEKMLELATKLAKDLPQVRVDFYNIRGKIYFGEMTMTSSSGMMFRFSQKALDEMGNLIILPKRSLSTKIKTWCGRYLPRL